MHNLYRVEKENSEKSFFVVLLLVFLFIWIALGGEALG